MRFILTSTDRAKSLAKGLKAAASEYGTDPTLSVSQAAVAVALGYKSFSELAAVTDRKDGPPSPFDESVGMAAQTERRLQQAAAFREVLGLDAEDAEHLALTFSLTSAARVSDRLAERLALEFEEVHAATPLAEHPNFSEQERRALSENLRSPLNLALVVTDDLLNRRRALNIDVRRDRTVSVALTAQQWRLFTEFEQAPMVADALNRAIEEAVKEGRSITKASWEVMKRYSRYGAADTVAVDVLQSVVEAIEGSSLSFNEAMDEIEGKMTAQGPSL